MPRTWDQRSVSPEVALSQLRDGNARFCDHARGGSQTVAVSLSSTDRPFAAVLSCSDAPIPPEVLFDQQAGSLYVVQVAGNIVAPSIVGSLEFAVSQMGIRTIVVVGHARCAAIEAAITTIERGAGPETRNARAVTERITPHIESTILVRSSSSLGDSELRLRAMRANVRASADHLRHASRWLEDLICADRLCVVEAEYADDTGVVTFPELVADRAANA